MSTSDMNPVRPGDDWPDDEQLRRLAEQALSALPSFADPQRLTPSSVGASPHLDTSPEAAPDAAASQRQRLVPEAREVGASPLAIGLPGAAELSGLFAASPIEPVVPNPAARSSFNSTPGFYFLDHGKPGTAAVQAPEFDDKVPSFTKSGSGVPLDVQLIRQDFPILQERINGRPLVWLDNAATTQKPRSVIERLAHFYEHENSNIHRAAHTLAARATDAYEGARERVRAFLGAASPNEIVFVRGGTEAINLVAKSWGHANIGKDDEVIVSWLEHHANIVPWQQLVDAKGARLRVIPVDDNGQIRLEEFAKLLGPKTKLVAVTHVSNALGTITPVQQIAAIAHAAGAKVLIDGAQAVSHMRVNVQAIDADWYVFSGHKLFGPTGIGALYGKQALLNEAPPWQGGGNMISDVTFERTQYHDAPARLEAGTGNIADAVGLGAAIDYVTRIGLEPIGAYEHQLLEYATGHLREIPGLRLIGTAPDKASVLSFVLNGHKTEDIGSALNREGIAVRAGHHCAQPILRRFGVESTVRPSLAFYNTHDEVDCLVSALRRIVGGRSTIAHPGGLSLVG